MQPPLSSATCSRPPETVLQCIDPLRRFGLGHGLGGRFFASFFTKRGEVRCLCAGHRIITGYPVLRILLGVRSRVIFQLGIVDLLGHGALMFFIRSERGWATEVPSI